MKKTTIKVKNGKCKFYDYPENSNTILLCVPSFKGGAWQFFFLGIKLRRSGFHVITMNFSYGWFTKKLFSDMSITNGKKELELVVSAVKTKYPLKKIVLCGLSFGGTICVAASRKNIDGLVLSSPPLDMEETLRSYFHYQDIKAILNQKYLYFSEPIDSPIKLMRIKVKTDVITDALNNFDYLAAAATIRVPVLIFYGENDNRLKLDTLKAFFAKLQTPAKKIVTIKGAGHDRLHFWFATNLSEEIRAYLDVNFSR